MEQIKRMQKKNEKKKENITHVRTRDVWPIILQIHKHSIHKRKYIEYIFCLINRLLSAPNRIRNHNG